jgi:hypothetical protein
MAVMKDPKPAEMVKTTMKLPKALWREARIRALDEDKDFQGIVASALTAYLKTPLKRKGGSDE